MKKSTWEKIVIGIPKPYTNNSNILAISASGSSKTQTLRAIMQLRMIIAIACTKTQNFSIK
jgi:lipopolysaccharide export LptBFGC system permease protein LptF